MTTSALGARLRRDVVLAPYTTYRFGGPARYLVEAESEDDLSAAGSLAAAEGLPVFVLGRGSNVVVSEKGFDGVVIRLGPGFATRTFHEDGSVTAGGAVPLPVLARESVKAGRGGLEFYVGIPGSVGGAVRMNAGCHGSDTAGWLLIARVVTLPEGQASDRTPGDLGLSYRHSDLGDADVVVAARFRTEPCPPEAGEARIREITRWRRDTQPGGTLNAGSVFKNPPGDAAGRIIDQAGLKGFRVGAVEVSTRHANFFVAAEGATASDLYALVAAVRLRVREATGIDLVPEVRFVGDFS